MKQTQLSNSKTRSRKQHWLQLIANWKKSGLTQKDYCSKVGINFSGFSYWRTRLRKEERGLLNQAFSAKSKETFKPVRVKALSVEPQVLSVQSIFAYRKGKSNPS